MSAKSYQDLQVKIVGLEKEIELLKYQAGSHAHAITWFLNKAKQATPSPIVGAPPTVKTFLQMYQEELHAMMQQQQANSGDPTDENPNTDATDDSSADNSGSSAAGPGSSLTDSD